MSRRFLFIVPAGTQAERRGGNVGRHKRKTVKTAQWWITQCRPLHVCIHHLYSARSCKSSEKQLAMILHRKMVTEATKLERKKVLCSPNYFFFFYLCRLRDGNKFGEYAGALRMLNSSNGQLQWRHLSGSPVQRTETWLAATITRDTRRPMRKQHISLCHPWKNISSYHKPQPWYQFATRFQFLTSIFLHFHMEHYRYRHLVTKLASFILSNRLEMQFIPICWSTVIDGTPFSTHRVTGRSDLPKNVPTSPTI